MKLSRKLLAIVLVAMMLLSAIPMSALALPVRISDVVVNDVEVMEEYDGSWAEGDEWFVYDISPSSLTIYYEDGGEESYDELWQLTDAGFTYNYYSNDEQTKETAWKAGESYPCTFELDGEQYTYNVNVCENPVVDVEIEPLELIENHDGCISEYFDEELNKNISYFSYEVAPRDMTVYFNDDTTVSGSYYDIYDVLSQKAKGLNYECDQSAEKPWGKGAHTANFWICGKKYEYEVNVVESPVKNVILPTIETYEKSGGYWEGHYADPDDSNSWVSNTWYHYNYQPEIFTVIMKDGREFTGESYEIEEALGTTVYFESGQSYENQWGVGAHTASVTIYGSKFTYQVNVLESPIESVSVEDISLIEKVEGNIRSTWDEESGKNLYWFEYDAEPNEMTVTMDDGSEFTGDMWDVAYEIEEEYGFSPSYSYTTNQSHLYQWSAGNYTATVNFASETCEYNIEITECPIVSVSIADTTIIENSNGYVDEESGNYIYDEAEVETTLVLKSGKTITSKEDYIYYDDDNYVVVETFFDTESQKEVQWRVGSTHTAEVWVGGFKTSINCTIAENPIKSVNIADVDWPEYSNGYYTTDYEGEEFFYYNLHSKQFEYSVTLKDDSVIIAQEHKDHDYQYGVKIDGKVYSLELDLPDQYMEPFTRGSYEITARILGNETTFNINIVEIPIASVIVEDITLTQDLDSYGIHGEDQYYYYAPEFTVVLKDGTRLDSADNNGGVNIDGNYYYLECVDTQEDEAWLPGNTYEVEGYVGGVMTTFNVTIEKSPIKDVRILKLPDKTTYKKGEARDLMGAVIEVCYTDGTSEKLVFDAPCTDGFRRFYIEKLDRYEYFELSYGGEGYEGGEFLSRNIEFCYKTVDSAIESITIENAENKDLYVTINGVKYKAIGFETSWAGEDDAEGYIILQNDQETATYYFEISTAIGNTFIKSWYYDEYSEDSQSVTSNKLDSCEWLKTAIRVDSTLTYAFMDINEESDNFDGTVTEDNIDAILSIAIHDDDDILLEEEEEVIDQDGKLHMYYYINGESIKKAVKDMFGIENIDLTLSEKYDEETGTYTWEAPIMMTNALNSGATLKFVDGKWDVRIHGIEGYGVQIKLSGDGIITSFAVCKHAYTDDSDAVCNKCQGERYVLSLEKGNELVKEPDGRWWYYKDGMRSYETTLFKYSGKWFYVEDGRWDSSVTALVKYQGKYFYVKGGKWQSDVTDIVKYQGKYFYLVNGKWDSTVNDLKKVNGKWYFIKNGKWDSTLESLHKLNGKWFLVKGGMWTPTTGLVKYQGKQFYVVGGKWQSRTGLYKIGSTYYYISGGKWSNTKNTLYKKSGKYFAIKGGKWYKSKVIITYSGKKYYCDKGYAQLSFSGKVKIGSKTYTVKKGIVK